VILVLWWSSEGDQTAWRAGKKKKQFIGPSFYLLGDWFGK